MFDACQDVAALFPGEVFDIFPAVESAVTAAAAAPIEMDFRRRGFDAPLGALADVVLTPDVAERLSCKVRAACLRLVPGAFNAFMKHAEGAFAAGMGLSFVEEGNAVRPAAVAATHDLNLHWLVIDALRARVVADEDGEPFSPRHWSMRRLCRAFHACLSSEIADARNEGCLDSSTLLTASPLHRRFFPHLRPLVTLLESFSVSFRPSAAGLFALHDVLLFLSASNSSAPLFLSVDVHVVLLLLQFHVQRIVVCAAMALVGVPPDSRVSCEEEHDRVLQVLARIFCAIGAIRAGGGALIETPDEWNARCSRARRHLSRLVPSSEKSAPKVRSQSVWNTLKLGEGLVAAVLVGCGTEVDRASYPADGQLASEVVWMCEMVSVSSDPGLFLELVGLSALFHDALDRLIAISSSGDAGKGEQGSTRDRLLARRAVWDEPCS